MGKQKIIEIHNIYTEQEMGLFQN